MLLEILELPRLDRTWFERGGACCSYISRVAVFHARDVGGSKTGPFLDIALRQFLCFTDGAYAVADEHGGF